VLCSIAIVHAQVRSKMAAFVVDIRQFDTATTVTNSDSDEQLTGVFVWLTKHLQHLSNTVSDIFDTAIQCLCD
jgi:hypothetical protein